MSAEDFQLRNAEETARNLERLMALGDANLAEAIQINDGTKRIPRQEVVHCFAIDLYRKAGRDPATGLLKREDASKILGVLNQMSDPEVVETFRPMRRHLEQPVSGMPGAFARLLQILVSRRNLRSMVKDHDNGIMHSNPPDGA